ncbi:MAG: hypothetical protein L0H84_22675 [Pseudonocardia sp.]|nr:hypothetical protein [Pseudonocardia sp.]
MVAVPDEQIPARPGPGVDKPCRTGQVARRRAVAVAESATELLRPRSDLARLLETFDRIDVLFVADEHEHDGGVVALPVAGAPAVDVAERDDQWDDDPDDADDDLGRTVAGLGHSGLTAHRLGLAPGFGGEVEPDIVAAMSELVGFDPEPGVYCLAPAVHGESAGGAINRAARRIAKVYGIPLLSYACMQLSVVGTESQHHS